MDPIEKIEQELLQLFNKEYLHTLNTYARYFANSRTAALSKLDQIDSKGFTLSYTEDQPEGLALKEVRVYFSSPCYDKESVVKMMTSLRKEAEAALSLKPDKTYVPPGREDHERIKHFHPNLWQLSFVVVYWAFLAQFVISDELPWFLSAIKHTMGGHEGAWNIVLAMIAVNVGLSVAILGFSIWASFPTFYVLYYPLFTLLGGFMVAGPVIKIAFKQRAKIDEKSKIGTL